MSDGRPPATSPPGGDAVDNLRHQDKRGWRRLSRPVTHAGQAVGRALRRAGQPRFGRWATRLISLVGIALIVVSATGWWLATRVLDDDGFADVVAQTSQRQSVRDYVADQATLRLAKSSSFVSSARPVVRKALSEVLAQPAVTEAVRAFARGAHEQVFEINRARRVNLDAQQASVTISSTLETVDPDLASKLPAQVLDIATTVSQSRAVDTLARSTVWIDALFVPAGVLGVVVLVCAVAWARDRVHAIRFTGLAMMVAGSFPVGLGASSPLFAAVGGTDQPGRGAAVAAFVLVLLGRLVGAGAAFILVGFLLALAPARDGADLRTRALRVRGWFQRSWTRPFRRFAAYGAVTVIGVLLLTRPVSLGYLVIWMVAVGVLYIGIVGMLRATGALTSQQMVRRIRKRQFAGVAALMLVAFIGMTTATAAAVASTVPKPKSDPTANGCNGYVELCSQRLNQIVWPATHNAMSSTAYSFYSAEHTLSVGEQLNAGAKVLLLDVYYGYEQDGLVRTNLAGAADRADLQRDVGASGVAELDRLGALTGTVDLSGKKKDLYFCHDYCELGAVNAFNAAAR